jgi:hypothetical protein
MTVNFQIIHTDHHDRCHPEHLICFPLQPFPLRLRLPVVCAHYSPPTQHSQDSINPLRLYRNLSFIYFMQQCNLTAAITTIILLSPPIVSLLIPLLIAHLLLLLILHLLLLASVLWARVLVVAALLVGAGWVSGVDG